MVCRQAGAFAGRGEWVTVGARNPEAWIATCSRVERRQARRRLRVSEMLRAMDLVDEAFVAGLLSIEHVEVLAHARNRSKATAAAFGRDEQLLVSWATAEPFHRFRHLVDEWLLHADEDDAEDRAARQHAQRRMHLSQSFENQWFGDLVLDPVNGEILNATLTRITTELFELDWAVTKKLLGRDPTGIELAELARTPAQRRADALVEMARRAETAPTNARTPRPLFTVLVGEQSFARVCELASGTIVARGAVAGWLNDALLERIVFDGPNRVLSVGHQRSFRGALRRPSKFATAAAPTRIATRPPSCATSTTSNPTRWAARPPSPTAEHSADSTTVNVTTPKTTPVFRTTTKLRRAPEADAVPKLPCTSGRGATAMTSTRPARES